VVEIPAHLSWAEAACLPCAGLTAWNALAYDGSLSAGKTVLIQGGVALFGPTTFLSFGKLGIGGVSLMTLKLA